MPRANWGVDAGTVNDFDRDSQYQIYAGPKVPFGVYQWRVKVLKFQAATEDKWPTLNIGLELVPRKGFNESQYKGFFVYLYRSIMDKNQFTYVPFLDAIGVTARDFVDRTIVDEEGVIRKIGAFKHDGNALILGELNDRTYEGKTYPDIRTFAAVGASGDLDYATDDDEEEYEEEAPKPARRKSAGLASRNGRSQNDGTRARRTRTIDDFDF